MVGPGGLEPLTSSVSRKRSNQLSYGPGIRDITRIAREKRYRGLVPAPWRPLPVLVRLCKVTFVRLLPVRRCWSEKRSGSAGSSPFSRVEYAGTHPNPRGVEMRTFIAWVLALACVPPAFAAGNEKEVQRVKDAGVVLKEILDIPDNIPKDLLDRAECVIVLPSVKKLAIGIGGSFGRGVMVCRSGEHFKG